MKGNYPERIVCLTEESTETLYLLGEEDRIIGISGFTVRPPRARKEKPKVSAFTSAKIDRILALEPDLVLGFSDLQADIAAELIRCCLDAGRAGLVRLALEPEGPRRTRRLDRPGQAVASG